MNRIIIFFLVFIFQIGLFAQSKTPIIGYDIVAWGSSVDVVKKHYSDIIESKSFGEIFIDQRYFTQSDVNTGGINTREFHFFKNKLYKVEVKYYDPAYIIPKFSDTGLSFSEAEILYNKLVSIYGKFDFDLQSPGSSYYSWRYNQYLTISYRVTVGKNDKYRVDIIYENPVVKEQIKNSKMQL